MVVLRTIRGHRKPVNRRPESATFAVLTEQRPTNLITPCDGHGLDFVTATGQILMAVHTRRRRLAAGLRDERLDALYFTLGTLSTAGTGSIYPSLRAGPGATLLTRRSQPVAVTQRLAGRPCRRSP